MSIEAVTREPRTVVAGGETLLITQIRTKQIAPVVRECLPIFGPLMASAKPGDDGPGVNVPLLIIEHVNTVTNLIAICTGKSPEWVGELEIDELINLAIEVLGVNWDFFVTRVLPLITQAAVLIGSLAQKPGSTPSSS